MTHPSDPELAVLLRDARLDEARALAAARVRAKPDDARARLDLADMLIVLGEWDKADNHADLAGTYDPSRAVGLALLRQLIRAATWRDQSFAERRPPDLVTEPDAGVVAALALLAGTALPADEPAALTVTVDGQAHDGFRDLDDRVAGVLEVLTGNGRYLWVPLSQVAALRPAKPERLRDLVWRPAEIEVTGGPSGTVYIPALYPFAGGGGDATHRLGRATDWVEEADGRLRGIGQRGWLAGDDILTLDGFEELSVAPDTAA
ncbi:type VI secretion system accessory protein TagJ [Sphingomonas sp. CFBP 8760]|uniref:type VI secretion system accessory protein TagJ n=1 Tax=Sphingomonas sp. CFBP 8760 TaxID=2775282 RepID=UPI001785FDE1|nr:type VI secretion system accessory protein TagJ [Sphingomonas sp. CFBP 8760]MBD8547685.1 SciE type virulence protein [Sphingomonas sp. CFBP 8760]